MNQERTGANARAMLLSGLLALALSGCGGEANTGSNGTGRPPPPTDPMMASGPITGLGPLAVSGTRLTDSGTQVLLNADPARPAGDLRLGMLADADGLVAPSTGDGIATTSVAQSVVVGPVTDLDAARGSLRVMGLPVRLDRNTLLEGVERLDQLAAGDRVEAFGLALPGNDGTLATRLIARRSSTDRSVEVLATVTGPGAAGIAAQGLRIDFGNAAFSLATPAGIQPAPAGPNVLSAGQRVRVRGTYDPASGVVTAAQVLTALGPAPSEGKWAYVEGFVLAQSAATRFQVGEAAVDTTDVATPLAIGMRVRLRGRMQAGVLRVDQVAVVAPDAQVEYVVEGPISSFASVADFTVRGERIDASLAVFVGGGAAALGAGRQVRVKGVAGPGRLNATEVTIL